MRAGVIGYVRELREQISVRRRLLIAIIVGVLLVEAPVEGIFRERIVWTRRRRASGRSVIGVCRVLLAEPEPEVVVVRLIFIRIFMLSVGVELLGDFAI